MNGWLTLATALAEGMVVRQGRQAVGRMAVTALATLLAALFGLAALACVCAALWIDLEPRIGPVGAPLVVAGLLALIGLGIVGGLVIARRRRRPAVVASLAPALVVAEAGRLFNEHKGAVLIAAVLAGLVAGGTK